MKNIKRKAKFYDIFTKVAKFGGFGLAVVGLGALIGTAIAGLTAAVVISGAVGFLGCGLFMTYPAAKVYADGYKAEVEMMNANLEVENVKIGDLIKEQEEKEVVYETPHEAFYSEEKETTK